MGRVRVELTTFRLKGDCSDRLSYRPESSMPLSRFELELPAYLAGALLAYKARTLPLSYRGGIFMNRVRVELTAL